MADETDFLLPDLGEGLEEATVVTWLVRPGDTVVLNQPLCVVETAKAEVEVPSPYAGVVRALGGAEGDTLAVGTMLVRIDREPTAPGAEGAGERPVPTLVGYGHDESIDRSRRGGRGGATAAPEAGRPPTAAAAPARPLAKPPVRMLARRLGIDLAELAPGSGPQGIVTRGDVEAAATHHPEDGDTVEPVRGIRARVAAHMATSRQQIPDATCSVVADCERLLDVRRRLNERLEHLGQVAAITPFSLMCGLLVRALHAHPELNATWLDEGPAVHVHRQIHLGVGTATDRGLLVTVVRDAGERSIGDLAAELARLSAAARDGSVVPADLQGSTITVSNFGALGLDEGIPVINHPEAAIVGIGAVRQRPHVVAGEVVARPTATITLAFDHRVADGAEAAALLCSFRDLIEAPELALAYP